jgi:threonine dehydratase
MDIDIGRDDIEAASRRIASDIRRTPLLRIDGGQLGIDGVELWLKLEHLQIGGSFKARGMFNRMRSNAIPATGVVIASGGNAAIAVACAAKALAVPCEVFVPESSSRAKRARLAALGAIVNVVGASYGDALAASLARHAESGALLMHAYDQREVVIGAATLAAEVEADAGVPDRALVSVGGGGLIGGICAWFAGRCAIDALEPELAPTLHRARAAGPTGRRRGVGNRRGFARRAPHRRDRVAADSAPRRRHRTCSATPRSATLRKRCGASSGSRSSRRRRCRWQP